MTSSRSAWWTCHCSTIDIDLNLFVSADHLIITKVVHDRPRDWVDIGSILTLDTAVDAAEALRWVGRVVGDDDPRYERVVALLTR